ncbi:hypothetical protein C5167_017744 [Papaver somniferum]|uniref:WW domain-containing protein n=1 Tax=Papaver somniferum TaxID=3469 RepID=A0A4Y7INN7_PAPSO|nr:uncharacterized protein LOC113347534 [Papaver somniferum]RZC49322.1 hypothetical protein C5167_017744 [Papaver somniferum]
MVSFQTPNFPLNQRKTTLHNENSSVVSLSKKRRLEEIVVDDKDQMNFEKGSNKKMAKVVDKTNLFRYDTENPLPSEWQRCLDIQSGEIHFYNTRTHKRTCKDPRLLLSTSPKKNPDHMGLDLELNLGYESSVETHVDDTPTDNLMSSREIYDAKTKDKPTRSLGGSSNWLSVEVDHREMVAAVCMSCHMLVMFCKSSPSCPNCRFMHPLEQIPSAGTSLSKPRLRFSHCKDGSRLNNVNFMKL